LILAFGISSCVGCAGCCVTPQRNVGTAATAGLLGRTYCTTTGAITKEAYGWCARYLVSMVGNNDTAILHWVLWRACSGPHINVCSISMAWSGHGYRTTILAIDSSRCLRGR
jgi:hypothetical protein